MTHYVLTVPVSYTKSDEERTRYSRVGAVFETSAATPLRSSSP